MNGTLRTNGLADVYGRTHWTYGEWAAPAPNSQFSDSQHVATPEPAREPTPDAHDEPTEATEEAATPDAPMADVDSNVDGTDDDSDALSLDDNEDVEKD